jgi:N-acetylglucosaminyldiphosphoundecaprenol N-acetyl-beta-D-mannosaminyltransferase
MNKTSIKQINSQLVSDLPMLSLTLLGRRITFMTVTDIVNNIHTACVEKKKIAIANYNVHGFNLSMQIPWFYNFLQSSEIAHCDSIGILKATEWMGLKLPLDYRASYTLLMPKLLEHCDRHGFSVFLLGAKPEYSDAAIERLQAQYPNIVVTGHHGYFDMQDPDDNDEVVKQINEAKPNILIVGMGMPIQEKWIHVNRDRLDTNVMMLGGAAIDRLAGAVPDCPALLSNIGLEWLYRLCREPKRLANRYLIGNLAFLLHIALAKSYAPALEVQLIDSIDNLENHLIKESFQGKNL